MKVNIQSNGELSNGTKVTNAETGERIDCIQSINIKCGQPVTAHIFLSDLFVENMAAAIDCDYYAHLEKTLGQFGMNIVPKNPRWQQHAEDLYIATVSGLELYLCGLCSKAYVVDAEHKAEIDSDYVIRCPRCNLMRIEIEEGQAEFTEFKSICDTCIVGDPDRCEKCALQDWKESKEGE